ncbi:RAI1 like PD-XK nuclease-domain-containing protein [Naematelia encephala]|uniref:Decapping nuclease n=1 Tax=Naematelia encephala TaxID=71784 RepID=A0A1Y2APK3_9TREE|nr:RAI1 like PD-XK nuclease-domain-containing protein [Naematelia encephala]
MRALPRRPQINTFLPLPARGLSAPPPEYHQPTIISTYSHLADRSIVHDDTSMSYYRPAPLGVDLNHGFETKIERDETVDEHLDGLCAALQHVHERGIKGERRGGIITWRGMITRIMTAPFEDREGWEMTAIALDGSIYIELHDPPEIRAKRRKDQSSWAWQSYMGYAYEAFSTVPYPSAQDSAREEEDPEGWSGDVNTNVQWCNVIRSSIGDVPLCLGGEVDCVRGTPGDPHPGLGACMELKTNKVIYNEKQEFVFHKKLLKHWAQSWLLGIPTIEVGFRDDAGILKSQREFETIKIPRFIASLPNPIWHPAPAHHFLYSVLDLVLKHVLPTDPAPPQGLTQDEPLPPADVWRFSFVPRRGCELYHVGHVESEDGRWGGVLPPDYVRWRMRKR